MLTERGILRKQRGIGMAVTEEALAIIQKKRRNLFFDQQLKEFIAAASKLGITREQLAVLILNERLEGDTEND